MSLDLKNTNLHTTGSPDGLDDKNMWQSVSGVYQKSVELSANDGVQEIIPEAVPDQSVRHEALEREILYAQGEGNAQYSSLQQNTAYKKSLYQGIGDEEPIDPTKPTVLVVDDKQETIDTYTIAFRSVGYNVVSAIDGLDGLDKATKVQPDLIFTGIIMPRMDGFAMISALRKSSTIAHTPVIMYSHLGRSKDRDRARELDVRDFIVEANVEPSEVVARIRAILTRNEYLIPLDLLDHNLEKLVKELGGSENIKCGQNQRYVIRLRVDNPAEMSISGKIECVDAQ
jgi:PleD family two-component response regulator